MADVKISPVYASALFFTSLARSAFALTSNTTVTTPINVTEALRKKKQKKISAPLLFSPAKQKRPKI